MKIKSINPHDQSVLGEIEVTEPEEILKTVNRANKAFKAWKETPIKKRAEYLKKYKQNLVQHQNELDKLTAQEMGKPLGQGRDDSNWELEFLDYYTTEGVDALNPETVYKKDKDDFKIIYEPFGVCACIAPWNYPVTMFNSGVVPALIAGNTVVFKPSEYSTLSQKLCADLLSDTGIPDGVFNLIIGGKETGAQLLDCPIDLIWFTGSSKVGQEVYQKAASKFIKALLEMGGNSAGIVFADADLDNALENVYASRFLCAGQSCNALKRLFIEKPIYDQFLKKLVNKLQKVSLGNPLDNPDMGPLVQKVQLDKLELQVQDAIEKGAKVEIGGRRPSDKTLQKGNYYEPTILTNINTDMKVATEEVFGPVLPVMSFVSESEVLEMTNNTSYGLSGEIYTADLNKAERLASQIEAGMIGINTASYIRTTTPFGGYKKSGLGREYGKLGMQEFTQVKLIAVQK